MIRAVIVTNDQGKPRLVKFYDYQPVEKQQEIIRNIYGGMILFIKSLATCMKVFKCKELGLSKNEMKKLLSHHRLQPIRFRCAFVGVLELFVGAAKSLHEAEMFSFTMITFDMFFSCING
uniref:Putative adaptor protein complex, sigma subunit, AP complex, mu/sigma subunit n=1 Tax=Helianthus annuus TaxID=4232 RepID=A0A251T452_HELAN